MQIKTTPMRTVTYLGVDVQIPAHHTAVAADGCGQVYSYADTPIEITTCWRSSNSYDSPYKVPARVDFAETVEWRNSLQLYPLAEANKVTAADLKGEIADFPLHVVQAMCDEQVRQGNPFSPAVFQSHREADLTHGGFNWFQSELGQGTWDTIIVKRAFHRMPAAAHPHAELMYTMRIWDANVKLPAAAHPHAELMMEYAKIARTTDKPWEHFEVWQNDSCVWKAIHLPMRFYPHMEYRLKPEPKTIRIGEYDVPEPVREPLENGTTCWYPKLSNIDLIDGYIWCNDDTDVRMLSNGLIHLTEEAAKAHAEALLSLTKAAD